MDKILMSLKTFDSSGFICPGPGAAINLYMTIIFKHVYRYILYIRSQVSVHRTIGTLVRFYLITLQFNLAAI